ncbi:MAG: hypothetical protein PF487_04945 [Bacteroidales bacterium]|jgi:hypothetical protein|nr:hypothetical protein [Bacteroidales bacterium]
MNKRNRERVDMLTETLFIGSKCIKNELIEAERERLKNENVLLFGDIKAVIDKHYKDREEALTKENEKLNKQLILKDNKINEVKEKISRVTNSK